MPTSLSDLDRDLLDFAAVSWRHRGAREAAILERFGMSLIGFEQRVNRLVDSPTAMEYAPITCRVLRARRERGVRERTAVRLSA